MRSLAFVGIVTAALLATPALAPAAETHAEKETAPAGHAHPGH